MSLMDRQYMTYCLVFHCYVSSSIRHFWVIWRGIYDLEFYVRVHWRWSKTATFDRLHTGSYSTSIVNMAVFCVVFEPQWDIG